MSLGNRKPSRVAVFISGGGSTLQALLEMQHQFNICLVVTNRKKALGQLKAKRFGKNIYYQSPQATFEDLQVVLSSFQIDKIVLAGYMKILPPRFVQFWKEKIINIHPSLLPAFPGLNSAERSWEQKVDMGVTLHQVNEHMDDGATVLKCKSSKSEEKFDLDEALIFLRRTEQHLLRELTLRWS